MQSRLRRWGCHAVMFRIPDMNLSREACQCARFPGSELPSAGKFQANSLLVFTRAGGVKCPLGKIIYPPKCRHLALHSTLAFFVVFMPAYWFACPICHYSLYGCLHQQFSSPTSPRFCFVPFRFCSSYPQCSPRHLRSLRQCRHRLDPHVFRMAGSMRYSPTKV